MYTVGLRCLQIWFVSVNLSLGQSCSCSPPCAPPESWALPGKRDLSLVQVFGDNESGNRDRELNDELALLKRIAIGGHALAKHALKVAGFNDFPGYGLDDKRSVVKCGDKFLEYTECTSMMLMSIFMVR
jgi:hypothetical protein